MYKLEFCVVGNYYVSLFSFKSTDLHCSIYDYESYTLESLCFGIFIELLCSFSNFENCTIVTLHFQILTQRYGP